MLLRDALEFELNVSDVHALCYDLQSYEMATSCKSSRSSTYSEDLHWRMVYQKEGMGLTYTEVAKDPSVDQSQSIGSNPDHPHNLVCLP